MTAAVASGRGGVAARATGPVAGAARFVTMFGVFAVGWPSIEVAFALRGGEGAKAEFRRWAGVLLDLFGIEVEVDGELCSDVHEVRVANHQSYLDILVLHKAKAGRFLSMHSVASWPMVGPIARHIDTLFVDRSSRESRTQALRALARAAQEGEALVIFPEGRTHERVPGRFEKGAFVAAQLAGVPLRPIAIAYDDPGAASWTGDAELAPHVWSRLCGPVVRCVVRPLPPRDVSALPPEEAASQVREAIVAALGVEGEPRQPV